jgi:hypothetical protein
MQPRLKTSLKWTALPAELIQQMTRAFGSSFRSQLKNRTVSVEGRIFPGEILLRSGLHMPGQLRQDGFEISIAYDQKKDNVVNLLHLGTDAAGALFENFFADENSEELPREWQRVDFEKREIYVRYTTENGELEAEADKLLGLDDPEGIARGDWDADVDASLVKAQLGLDEED